MTSDQLAQLETRVLAIPNPDPGLGGFFTRVITPNGVTTHRIVHRTEAEAIAYGKARP